MAKDTTCLLSKNLTKEDFCGYSLKQITDIYLANYTQVGTELTTAAGSAIGESGYIVSGITGETKWYHVEPAKDSSSYNDDLVIGGNGSKYRTHTMTFSFNSAYSEDVAQVLDKLSLGRFVAVLKLSDGNGIMLGRLTGLEAETATLSGGGDTNGLQIVLSANVTESAVPLSAGAIATVKGAE